MKKIAIMLAILLATAVTVKAAPFIVSDDFTSSIVDKCVVTIDGVTSDVVPSPTEVDRARCVVDVGSVGEGAHSVTLHTENIWGGSTPVPFDFTKELPPILSGIKLEN